MEEQKMKCKHGYKFDKFCGAKVCAKCNDHEGMSNCFCGWSSIPILEAIRHLRPDLYY